MPRSRESMVAEFASADALLEAVRRLRSTGHAQLETYTPYEVPGLEALVPRRRSPLPALVFAGGAFAAAAAYGVQWYGNVVRYPQNAGGRPPHAVGPFLISTFEGLVLGAAIVAFFGLLFVLGLPRLSSPIFELPGFERVTRDRFWLAIERPSSADDDELEALLRSLDALSVQTMKGSP